MNYPSSMPQKAAFISSGFSGSRYWRLLLLFFSFFFFLVFRIAEFVSSVEHETASSGITQACCVRTASKTRTLLCAVRCVPASWTLSIKRIYSYVTFVKGELILSFTYMCRPSDFYLLLFWLWSMQLALRMFKSSKTIVVIDGIYVTLTSFWENPSQDSCALLSDGYTWSVSVRTQAMQKSTPEKTTFVPAVGLLLQSRPRIWTQAQSSTLSLPPCTRILRQTCSRLKSTQTLNLAPRCLLKCTMTRNPNYSLFHCTRIQGLFRPPSRRRSWTRRPQGLVGFCS